MNAETRLEDIRKACGYRTSDKGGSLEVTVSCLYQGIYASASAKIHHPPRMPNQRQRLIAERVVALRRGVEVCVLSTAVNVRVSA